MNKREERLKLNDGEMATKTRSCPPSPLVFDGLIRAKPKILTIEEGTIVGSRSKEIAYVWRKPLQNKHSMKE